MSEYEIQRLLRIRRNEAKLASLGLLGGIASAAAGQPIARAAKVTRTQRENVGECGGRSRRKRHQVTKTKTTKK
jgi:hypothetical protein